MYMSIEVVSLIKVRARFEPAVREQLMKSPLEFLQEYDLTEDEKKQIILPHFSWLVENKLAALSYPESEDAFTILWKIGIRALLNLAEVPLPGEILKKVGILTEHIPIVGFTAPTRHQVEHALAMIHFFLAINIPVSVHCDAGLVRTATILPFYLAHKEPPPNSPITS